MKSVSLVAFILLIVLATIASLGQTPSKAAASLQGKIDTIKKADADKKRVGTQSLDVLEPELEAYVQTSMKKDIPVQLESIKVRLTPGTVAADARLTIPPGSTGNMLVDAIIGGTHNLLIKGKLTASRRIGKFDLQDLTVDGIPVPNILIDVLLKKYVKPKYPNVDLKEPFDLPWGIDAIQVMQSKAKITY
jgi:hypothetical protein